MRQDEVGRETYVTMFSRGRSDLGLRKRDEDYGPFVVVYGMPNSYSCNHSNM